MLWNNISQTGILAALLWTIVVSISLMLNIQNEYQNVAQEAIIVARANLNKDQAIRQWVSRHGGLYGKISDNLKPSPYLAHIASRDIETELGSMTLLNPAYILRLMMDDYASLYGVKGRIVGLKALRPENVADTWERKIIDLFAQHPEMQEYSEVSRLNGKDHLRMMVPMYMQQACMKCHAVLGYKSRRRR